MGAAALGWPTLLLALLPPCTFSGIADFTGAAGAGVLWSTSPDPPHNLRGAFVCVGGGWVEDFLGVSLQDWWSRSQHPFFP